jgi:hypothetical protein
MIFPRAEYGSGFKLEHVPFYTESLVSNIEPWLSKPEQEVA